VIGAVIVAILIVDFLSPAMLLLVLITLTTKVESVAISPRFFTTWLVLPVGP
jgi:hypothetical protein